MNNDIILKVDGLKTYFNTDDGIVKAVDGVSFELKRGETLGLVGESGSGKSVSNLSLMKLIPSPPGKIMAGTAIIDGDTDILSMTEAEIRELRGNKIAMIFQDPMTSLNPFLRISTQMIETLVLHQNMN
ncbi:MAG: ABC transporter ATP-binding protein, partial [Spirochaetales bacterium]|nr:ABC transporter ATP-binding protein [Spirochaetales bacterium]